MVIIGKKRLSKKKVLNRVAYVFIAPALISIFVFTLLPVLYTIYISFTNYNMMNLENYSLVGLANYISVMAGSLAKMFFPLLLWTVGFAFLSTAGSYFMGMGLAILLNNSKMKEAKLYKGILILPWALPATIAILAWQGLLNEQYGGINMVLSMIGIHSIPWLTNPLWARFAIIMVNIWLGFPYMLNVCLGGLQSIDKTYYEVAKMEGASNWESFKRVTFPMLTKVSIPLVISSFASNFNNFGNIYMITQGGPPKPGSQFAGSTDILASAIYKMTTWSNRYELSATLSVISFILVAGMTLLNMKVTRAFEEE
jgi:arabinogalactan oligomer/maltooligosaccharide transport system permease protein